MSSISYQFLTVRRIAQLLQLNPLTVYSYIRSGKLSAVRFGRYYRVLKLDFDRFISAQKVRL